MTLRLCHLQELDHATNWKLLLHELTSFEEGNMETHASARSLLTHTKAAHVAIDVDRETLHDSDLSEDLYVSASEACSITEPIDEAEATTFRASANAATSGKIKEGSNSDNNRVVYRVSNNYCLRDTSSKDERESSIGEGETQIISMYY
jgi:hypothetical protein